MGAGRFDPSDWVAYASSTAATKPTVDHIYTRHSIDPGLDPKSITIRESRDSAANPASTALIVGLDVTGSMGVVLDEMARRSMGALIEEIYGRKPISDPHMMILGIGDVECDASPLQATQFEAEVTPLTAQLEKIHLERGGGGNGYESYAIAWLFAAMNTSIDCFEKRGKKGYLFTVGDEEPTPILRKKDLERVLMSPPETDLDAAQLLEMVSRTYHVFHVMVEQGSHYRTSGDIVKRDWTKLIGQRALPLSDHSKLAELIVSAIQVNEGADVDAVVKSWSGATSVVVAKGIAGLPSAGAATGVVRL